MESQTLTTSSNKVVEQILEVFLLKPAEIQKEYFFLLNSKNDDGRVFCDITSPEVMEILTQSESIYVLQQLYPIAEGYKKEEIDERIKMLEGRNPEEKRKKSLGSKLVTGVSSAAVELAQETLIEAALRTVGVPNVVSDVLATTASNAIRGKSSAPRR